MHFLKRFKACLLEWHAEIDSPEALAQADVIIAQAFGRRQSDPGPSNQALAEVVARIAKPQHLPVILQWEVADAYSAEVGESVYVVRSHRQPGKYLDTLEVLEQAALICHQHGWQKAVIVAHPDHAWRVVANACKLGFTVLTPDTSNCPYDPESVQSWTRSAWLFLPREIVARLLCLVRGQL